MNSPIKTPSLADLRAFMAVVEHRSFRRAADLLGVTRSALSHAMRNLEDSLGVRLLHRTTRSVAPTEAGERLLSALGPVLGDLSRVLENIGGADASELTGSLRINGPEAAIGLLLQKVVPAFMTRHPRVQLDLVVDGSLVDVVEQGYDAGIRLGESVPKDMVAVRLGPEVRFLAVAAPAYLQAHPAPTVPDELSAHACIRQRLPSGKRYRWEFRKHGQDMAVDVPGILTLNDSGLLAQAAMAGLGIAYVPESYAREALDDGRLVAVLEDWCPSIPGLFLYYPGHRHVPAALCAFIDVIRQTLG